MELFLPAVLAVVAYDFLLSETGIISTWRGRPVAIARWLNRDPLLPDKGAQAKDPKSHRFYYQAGDHQKEEQFPEPGDICQVCSRPRGEHLKVCGFTDSPSMDWLATYLKNLGLEEARKEDP